MFSPFMLQLLVVRVLACSCGLTHTTSFKCFMVNVGLVALGSGWVYCSIIARQEMCFCKWALLLLAEHHSSMLQVSWFRYSEDKKYGEGR